MDLNWIIGYKFTRRLSLVEKYFLSFPHVTSSGWIRNSYILRILQNYPRTCFFHKVAVLWINTNTLWTFHNLHTYCMSRPEFTGWNLDTLVSSWLVFPKPFKFTTFLGRTSLQKKMKGTKIKRARLSPVSSEGTYS